MEQHSQQRRLVFAEGTLTKPKKLHSDFSQPCYFKASVYRHGDQLSLIKINSSLLGLKPLKLSCIIIPYMYLSL